MDVKAMGQVGLTGWRGRIADPVAGAVSNRTPLSKDEIKAIIGGIFLLLTVLQFARTVRRLLEAGREDRG